MINETKKMVVGDKLIIIAPEQVMVLEVLPNKNGTGILVYRAPLPGEI
jgi:hypothetical protein